MTKLKHKQKTCAKNAHSSKARMEEPSCKILKILTYIQRILSIYKIAKALGWLDGLHALLEKIGAVMKVLYSTFFKHM